MNGNVGNILYTVKANLSKTFYPPDMIDWDQQYLDTPEALTDIGKRIWNDLYNNDVDAIDELLYIASGAYDAIEDSSFLEWLESNKYDSFYVSENGKLHQDKSIGVMDMSVLNIIDKESV